MSPFCRFPSLYSFDSLTQSAPLLRGPDPRLTLNCVLHPDSLPRADRSQERVELPGNSSAFV